MLGTFSRIRTPSSVRGSLRRHTVPQKRRNTPAALGSWAGRASGVGLFCLAWTLRENLCGVDNRGAHATTIHPSISLSWENLRWDRHPGLPAALRPWRFLSSSSRRKPSRLYESLHRACVWWPWLMTNTIRTSYQKVARSLTWRPKYHAEEHAHHHADGQRSLLRVL
jgi:hypothetical protein